LNDEARAKFTIFLGAAAGVGKTYTMLSEAKAQLNQGLDVRVGFVETHGRAETAAMIGELPVIPKKNIEYRGSIFEEMDLDAIIADHPQLVLIDELAHTNIPGERHRKRYDDIMEVLGHGIDVWSTVNIQHLESLNVMVYELTGVKVRETFPDYILARADEIRLIDISPEALIERLKAGKVYPPGKIERALSSFFQKSNLTALRELSLREVADEVEEAVSPEEAQRAVIRRIMVCVGPETNAQRIIRRSWRLAKRFNTDLTVAYMRKSPGWFAEGPSESPEEESWMEALRQLAAVLDVEFVEIDEDEAATGIVQTALDKKVGLIVMGRPRSSGLVRFLREPLLLQVLQKTSKVDVFVMNDEDAGLGQEGKS
jgi:two-component system sensor histidine kinase KdpD